MIDKNGTPIAPVSINPAYVSDLATRVGVPSVIAGVVLFMMHSDLQAILIALAVQQGSLDRCIAIVTGGR